MSVDFAQAKRTQRVRVLELLSDLAWHEWRALAVVGGNRYGARLRELRRQGYRLETAGEKVSGQRYRLLSATPGEPQPKMVRVFLHEEVARRLHASTDLTEARLALESALATFAARRNQL